MEEFEAVVVMTCFCSPRCKLESGCGGVETEVHVLCPGRRVQCHTCVSETFIIGCHNTICKELIFWGLSMLTSLEYALCGNRLQQASVHEDTPRTRFNAHDDDNAYTVDVRGFDHAHRVHTDASIQV